MFKGRSRYSMPNLAYQKLNKQCTKYTTCPCIPHQPIYKFMREHHIGRSQVFRLARKNLLSMTRVGKRYFVAKMPDLEDVPMSKILEM